MKLGLAVDIEAPRDADRLLRPAVGWAEHTDGTLDLLYVEPTHATTSWIQDPAAVRLVRVEIERMHQLARTALTRLLERVPEPHRGMARVLEGAPVQALVTAS